MKLQLACLSIVLGISACSSAIAADFNVTVARKYQSDKCTSGYLAVSGEVIAYTLELPWRGNKPEISSIPTGQYDAILRYDHADKWRMELRGVPGRGNVQIHIGNTTDDIRGCILVGTGLGSDLCSIAPGTSVAAYRKLKAAFYGSENPVSTPNKTIKVVVED